jgi:hypothetical protein
MVLRIILPLLLEFSEGYGGHVLMGKHYDSVIFLEGLTDTRHKQLLVLRSLLLRLCERYNLATTSSGHN